MHVDVETIKAALMGYESERQRIQTAIAEIQKQLGGRRSVVVSDGLATERKKRTLSAAARRSIAAAQRKRWKAFKKQKAAAE